MAEVLDGEHPPASRLGLRPPDALGHTPSTMPIPAPQPDALKSFLSGGIGGMALVAVGHPLDLIKVRLQTATNGSASMYHTFSHILKHDGLRGLYRGMLTPLVGVTPIFAVCFWGYDVGRGLGRRYYSAKDERHPPSDGIAREETLAGRLRIAVFAGGFSALPTTLIMTPSERIKVMLQIQGAGSTMAGSRIYSGPLDVLRDVGLRNLYKGTLATLARDVPGSMAYFGVYEAVKLGLSRWLVGPGSGHHDNPEASSQPQLPVLAILMAGGLAGWANWLVAIPADVIKSRIQSGVPGSGLSILRHLLASEGPRALFKGLGPALVRSFPANAACFLGVELSLQFMNRLW